MAHQISRADRHQAGSANMSLTSCPDIPSCHQSWRVQIAEEFDPEELSELPLKVRRSILAHSRLLGEYGPQLGRPRVDMLNGLRHANTKEMRLTAAGGEWRVAFAFDPVRHAMLLVAGDKSGGSGRRFYREPIRRADERFDRHLARLEDG